VYWYWKLQTNFPSISATYAIADRLPKTTPIHNVNTHIPDSPSQAPCTKGSELPALIRISLSLWQRVHYPRTRSQFDQVSRPRYTP
jgi:hypothetical protein